MNIQSVIEQNVSRHSTLVRQGIGDLFIQSERPDRVVATGRDFAWIDEHGKVRSASDEKTAARILAIMATMPKEAYQDTGLFYLRKPNAYVNTGLNNSLDREFVLGGSSTFGFIGVSSNTTAVVATTVFLNGTGAGTAANTIIKAVSPAASRSAQTVTGGATFVNADFTSGVFVWNKLGFLTTSTDAGTGLLDVIGGTGGSSPYNRTFSLDLTAAGTFSVTAQIAVTASAI